MTFKELKPDQLDVIITGLRLVRRGTYDNRTRNVAAELLEDAIWQKKANNRKPEWETA